MFYWMDEEQQHKEEGDTILTIIDYNGRTSNSRADISSTRTPMANTSIDHIISIIVQIIQGLISKEGGTG